MPTISAGATEYHLNFMQRNEIFAYFRLMQLDSGILADQIASETTLFDVLKKDFIDLKIRERRAVDGKDVVRAALLDALMRAPTKKERDHLRHLRQLYRESIRHERSFYWQARNRAARDPEHYETLILDGATQSYCLVPQLPGIDTAYGAA